MKRIKRIGVYQTSKMAAVIYFFMVAILLIPVSIFIPSMSEEMGFPFARGFVILVPFLYAIFGFLGTAIACLFYNVVAKYIGGIEMEIEVMEDSIG